MPGHPDHGLLPLGTPFVPRHRSPRSTLAHTRGLYSPLGADCDRCLLPSPPQRDPNYLTEAEAEENAWVAALAHIPLPRGLHVDVHGKADREGEADLDVGVGALRAHSGHTGCDGLADTVAGILADALRAALAAGCAADAATPAAAGGPEDFSVDARPRLQGCWRSVPRRTLTQSSARLGYVPVQLELGYRLRRALGRDRGLCTRVAAAFTECAPLCVEACRAAMPDHVPDAAGLLDMS